MGENKIKVLLIEDHPLTRRGLASCLTDTERCSIVGEAGAMGYVPKSASEKEFLQAIDTVMQGELFIDPRLVIKINGQPDVYAKFTRRERETLTLVKQHYDNQQIAKALSLSLHTVENHISHIYFKTGLTKREELGNL